MAEYTSKPRASASAPAGRPPPEDAPTVLSRNPFHLDEQVAENDFAEPTRLASANLTPLDDRTHVSSRAPDSTGSSVSSANPFKLGIALEGEQLGHFLLEKFVGGGGMGAVFRALDTMLGRVVAVKVLSRERTDADTLRRFKNEAQSAARLDHKNIARVHYVGEDNGWNYIVFEFIDGVNVRDVVERNGPLDIDDALHYTMQVAEALDHAAQRDVVHRDIKPSNIIVTPGGRAKLVDMGLARLHQVESSNDDITASGVTLGTFDYISPEQARDPRAADVRSDIYSLGCTLYYMLSGRPPFPDGTVLQKLLSHNSDRPPDLQIFRPDVPTEIVEVVNRMLAKQPSQRYQTPAELMSELLLLAQRYQYNKVSAPVEMWSDTRPAAPSIWERHLPWAAPLAILIFSVLAMELLLPASQPNLSDLRPAVAPADAPPPAPKAPATVASEATAAGNETAGNRSAEPTSPQADEEALGGEAIRDHDDSATEPPSRPTDPVPAASLLEAAGGQPAPSRSATAADEPATPRSPADATAGGSAPQNTASAIGASTPTIPPSPNGGSTAPTLVPSPAAPDTSNRTAAAAVPSRQPAAAQPATPQPERRPSDESLAGGGSATGESAPPAAISSRPEVIVVARQGDSDAQTVARLVDALRTAAASDKIEEIQLQFDGPVALDSTLYIDAARLRMVAAPGRQPELTFEPVESDRSHTGMLVFRGQSLELTGVRLTMRAPEQISSDTWALLLADAGAERLDIRDSVLTFVNPQAAQIDEHGAAFIRLEAVSTRTMRGDDAQSPPAMAEQTDIHLERCVARGEASLVRSEHGKSVSVFWTEGLLATSERLLDMGNVVGDALPSQVLRLSLTHVTAVTEKGLCRLGASSDTASHPLPLDIECNECIVRTSPDAPLVDQWVADPQRHDPAMLFSLDQTGTRYSRTRIRHRFAGDVRDYVKTDSISWPNTGRDAKPWHEHTPDDYIPQPTADDDTRSASSAGFNKSRLPRLTEAAPSAELDSVSRSGDSS